MTASSLIQEAAAFAAAAHQGQVRKYTGDPYITHCEAVARRVTERGGSDEMIAAAWLHDTVEDCDVSHDDIRQRFGANVADLVEQLTDVYTREDFPQLNRQQRKARECERWKSASQEAIAIKLCDLIHNTRSILIHDPAFAKIYMREKADLLEAMGF